MTDIGRHFLDRNSTRAGAGGGVAAGVARVPDVGVVGGNRGPAGGGGYDTADSEACSTGGVRGAPWSLHTLTRSCHVSLLWTRRVERLTWELVTHRPRLLLWTHSEFLN